MKISLEIPDDCVEDFKERHLYVFAGIDLVARKPKGGEWNIKVSKCSQCGKCCSDLTERHPFPAVDGKCIHLINPSGYGKKMICRLGICRPFACAISNPAKDYCTVKYVEQGD
jgi:hypothetical protein